MITVEYVADYAANTSLSRRMVRLLVGSSSDVADDHNCTVVSRILIRHNLNPALGRPECTTQGYFCQTWVVRVHFWDWWYKIEMTPNSILPGDLLIKV